MDGGAAELPWGVPWELLTGARPHSSQTHSNSLFFLAAPQASNLSVTLGREHLKVTHNPHEKLLHPQNMALDITFSIFIKLHALKNPASAYCLRLLTTHAGGYFSQYTEHIKGGMRRGSRSSLCSNYQIFKEQRIGVLWRPGNSGSEVCHTAS